MIRSVSGIRGVIGSDMSPKDAMGICGSFAAMVESGRCAIGMDTRATGPMMRDAACAALLEGGIDVLDFGIAPTPVIFYEARKCGAGLIVSASHNPLKWNGLKFVINGRGSSEAQMHNMKGQKEWNDKAGTYTEARSDYIQRAREFLGTIKNPPSIAIDFGGGAAAGVADKMLSYMGCDVRVINAKPNDSSRGPDPTADDLADLITACASRDAGYAFDLDGDRLVIIMDGKRQIPDATLLLGAAWALLKGRRKFVLSTDTSDIISEYIIKKGGSVRRAKVGEANVTCLMAETGAQAGGEGSSGGFIVPEFNWCRDGILCSGIISYMIGAGLAGEALESIKDAHILREKIRVRPDDAAMKRIESQMRGEFERIDVMDGIRAENDGEWVMVRRSNTEDITRISAESASAKKTGQLVRRMMDIVGGAAVHPR